MPGLHRVSRSAPEEPGFHIAAISYEAHVEVPGSLIGGALGNVGGIIAREAGKSREAALGLLAAFQSTAEKAGLSCETLLEKCRTTWREAANLPM